MKGLDKYCVLLQNHLKSQDETNSLASVTSSPQWVLFSKPRAILVGQKTEEVPGVLKQIEEYKKKGFYAAGYVAYEAASALGSHLVTHSSDEHEAPLIWFGIYENYKIFDFESIENGEYRLDTWQADISESDYIRNVAKIKDYIERGDTYQVNYTFKLDNTFSGSPLAFFRDIVDAQQSNYCAYINTGFQHICSASPELFFEHSHGCVRSRPMKGTTQRGLSTRKDKTQRDDLFLSEKNRAENVMIVDMIRNDIGRCAETGSVKVDQLFAIEQYPTVYQLTSSVSAKSAASSVDIFKEMFPCASITGAPKVRTMEIIKSLETRPRGIYTGSIGFFAPTNSAQFNVAIRTVVLDENSRTASYGVGGGVVWDSEGVSEFNECALKAKVLSYRLPEFELIETLLWRPGKGYQLLEMHLDRLGDSADYFGFQFDREKIHKELVDLKLSDEENIRVRLSLAKSGEPNITYAAVTSLAGQIVSLSKSTSDTQSPYVYHKTTNRRIYESVLADAPGWVDCIIINNEGFVTESTIANVVVLINGKYVTPAEEHGLLPGTYRQFLLDEDKIIEGSITARQLLAAEEVYLINSVRGWMKLERQEKEKWQIVSESYCIDPLT